MQLVDIFKEWFSHFLLEKTLIAFDTEFSYLSMFWFINLVKLRRKFIEYLFSILRQETYIKSIQIKRLSN